MTSKSDDNSESLTNMGLGRRRFLAGAAGVGTVAAAGHIAPRYSPIGRASALSGSLGLAATSGAYALSYLVSEGPDYLLGDERDYSGYTGGDALHAEIIEGAASNRESDEITIATLQNNIEYSDNIALPKGKAAAVESMNSGGDSSDATNAMQEALDETYTVIQENLLAHIDARMRQWQHWFNQVEGNSDLAMGDIFWARYTGSRYDPSSADFVTESRQLFDGSSYDYLIYRDGSGLDFDEPVDSADDHHRLSLRTPDDNYSAQWSINRDQGSYWPVWDMWEDITASRDRVNANLSTFISDLYSTYEPGEIPLDDVVDPFTAYTEMNQDFEDGGYYGYAAASAATLGIPTATDATLILEVETADGPVEVTADIYTSHEPTDENGDPTDFETGVKYTPSEWDEPVFIAYETAVSSEDEEPERDFAQLEDPFTILEAYDSEGGEIESFGMESKNLQTADVEALREELEQLRELQLEMQEEAEAGAGGGGLFDSNGALIGLGAIAALLAALGLSN